MMKFFAFVAMVAILASCQSPQQESLEKINEMEAMAFSESGLVNAEYVDELIEAYQEFVDEFPEDSLAPDYLFKAGDVAMHTNRSNKAILLYERIINEYGDYRKAPEALFLKGYVYENNLGRLDKAESIYREFLEKYPNNEFADDAEVSLKYLGKTPEELIEIFQKENAAKQAEQ